MAQEAYLIAPLDAYNQELLSNVRPQDWRNPEPRPLYDLVVIGAGTAGLVTAAGAAGLGARVALVEHHLMGGDCLNTGCVPSKGIIRSSRIAGEIKKAASFGVIVPEGWEIDFPEVMKRMRSLRAHISHHDSARRFQEMGIDVFLGKGRFVGPKMVEVGDKTLRFKKAVIATGSRASSPPLPGLSKAGFLTNETVFSLTCCPARLAVIGAGPLGCELAQAFQRLGSKVTLFHKYPRIMNREDHDAARIVEETLREDGIELELGVKLLDVTISDKGKRIHFEKEGKSLSSEVDEILVGIGRSPYVETLNLEAAGVAYDPRKGVTVNDYLQTTNRSIYAAGDVCMEVKFTHAADAAARIVIQNALFLGRKKISALTIPWCTYTDPEVAHVGLSEKDAEERKISIQTFMKPLSEVDRAVLDGEERGFVKIHVRQGTDNILGATIVARHAGEMINEITLSMVNKIGLGKLSGVIHPYPTQAEAIRKAADDYRRTLLTSFVKKLFSLWLRRGWF